MTRLLIGEKGQITGQARRKRQTGCGTDEKKRPFPLSSSSFGSRIRKGRNHGVLTNCDLRVTTKGVIAAGNGSPVCRCLLFLCIGYGERCGSNHLSLVLILSLTVLGYNNVWLLVQIKGI